MVKPTLLAIILSVCLLVGLTLGAPYSYTGTGIFLSGSILVGIWLRKANEKA